MLVVVCVVSRRGCWGARRVASLGTALGVGRVDPHQHSSRPSRPPECRVSVNSESSLLGVFNWCSIADYMPVVYIYIYSPVVNTSSGTTIMINMMIIMSIAPYLLEWHHTSTHHMRCRGAPYCTGPLVIKQP